MTTGTHDNSLVSLPDAKESKLALASKAVDQERQPLDARFWLVFLGIGIATMITALELSAVSVALPTITQDLHGSSFIWVGSAYTLAGTAFIPLSGGLSQIFGRRIVILSSLAIMALGSALCGSAKNMTHMIAGRTVQGLGGGGISATTAIIISDLVPLSERGIYNGLIGIAWAMASGIGPIVGGALAQKGQWRWLFYLNIPICGVAGAIMILFLRVRAPPGTLKEKVRRIDWLGTFLVIAATTACVIGLTWSGVQYSWSSAPVLAPLIIGLVGMVVFIMYECIFPEHPLVPSALLSTITGISGYMQTFLMPVVMIGVIYYIPVYLQACKGASAIGSGVDALSFSLVIAPIGLLGGAFVNRTGGYRVPLWTAWIILMVGTGLLITLDADTPLGHTIGFLVPCALGCGLLAFSTYFPVLAPLHVSQNGLAIAFFMFLRNFAMVWGVTIGGTVLQNELQRHLPPTFIAQFPEGTVVAYATIPAIASLPEPLRTEVREAFAASLKVVWEVLLAVGGLGFVSSLFMKAVPLHTAVDDQWGLQQQPESDNSISTTTTAV
ncbi:iron permease [Fomitopsis serialis]|uniref:iron permease n=1 Tax=Fomitopsis serialis TaxID=139415 RepID=UPI002008BC67|nr:iron permease [Neoantrodia serialis]KAH9918458.1 iron permease [Neoantrodia serialis]